MRRFGRAGVRGLALRRLELGRLADAGELAPTIDSTYPLERAQEAFGRVAERGKRGKVVLDVAG
jgi:NADPH:quinone reductase-like Zn-dependent oxidoreductase